MSSLTIAEAADHAAAAAMDQYVIVKSAIYTSGEHDPREPQSPQDGSGKLHLMGHDPRLSRMPDRPTLFDFFEHRFGPCTHMLQSARLAQMNGAGEKIVLACLLHDIATSGFIRADHGYWGAQLVEPYVDAEVAFAIRYHQVLRFYPDASVGYDYPQSYIRLFGADFRPEPYVERAYEYARNHKWYMSARLLTVNDLYAFDPNVHVELEEFTDIVGRHFRQPEEGLGFDDSPSAHMWRTINWPTRYL
ncbi:MAG: HD domain-containing protein [Burkholderiales bacterium]|nr:HD domain-containing protein [Burkholderiales bacterium]